MAEGDALHVTALLAATPEEPIVIYDGNAALRMAVVDRGSLRNLDEGWDSPGVYLLLDPVTIDGEWGVYVGKAPGGLRVRLRQHVRAKEHWSRALLVTRDTTHGWHSAQVAWLEGRLYDLLDGAAKATLSNGNRPQDETLPGYERAALEAAVEPISAVLRLLGRSPDAYDEDADPSLASPAKKHYGVTVKELIQAGDLRPGEQVASVRRSAPATGTIDAQGRVVVDGRAFDSPSAAGAHVRGGRATNGWNMWAVEREGTTVPLATIRARYLRRREATPPTP